MDDRSLKKVIAKVEYEKGKSYLASLEKKPRTIFKPYMIAASVLVLLGVFFIWNITSSNKANSQNLYVEYYSAYPNIVAPVIRNVSAKTMEERAFYSYESKDYDIALKTFDSILLKNQSDKQIIHFYKANIYLETEEKADKAITLLKSNLKTSNSWKDKNLWYLSLAYLKNNEPQNALKTLKQLDELSTTFKKQKRLQLLNQLKNN